MTLWLLPAILVEIVILSGASTSLMPNGVATDHFTIKSLMTGGNSAYIAYPTVPTTAGGSYPLLVFGHGAGCTGSCMETDYAPLFTDLVKSGFIVVAPESCSAFCLNFYEDILATIKACREDPGLHPALKQANFTSVGLIGHSMGGWSAQQASQFDDGTYKISAVANLHGGCVNTAAPAKTTAPTLFTSGSADVTVLPSIVKQCFASSVNSKPRIFAEVAGITHFQLEKMYPLDIAFLRCHVSGSQDDCTSIYGTGSGSLCEAVPMTECSIVPAKEAELAREIVAV